MQGFEVEIISRVIGLVSLLSCIAWATIGLRLNISSTAAKNFSMANVMLIGAGLVASVRVEHFAYRDLLEVFCATDLLVMLAVGIFRSGMHALHGLPCTGWREYAVYTGVAIVTVIGTHLMGVPHAGVVFVYLVSSWYSLLGFHEANNALVTRLDRMSRWAILWPMALAGVLFLLRAIDDTLIMTLGGDMKDTQRENNFTIFMWTQLFVVLLVNASLIGQTLLSLFQKVQAEADRLQNILDTAPVGVAVSTEGIVRFANPRVTDLLDLKVGDPVSQALVNREEEDALRQQIGAQGGVRDIELQMYCKDRTTRDLLVTYLPLEYEGSSAILAWIVDITERKKTERAIQQAGDQMAAMFEAATLGIAFVRDWRIVRANHRMEALFGWGAGELVGKTPQLWNCRALHLDDEAYQQIHKGDVHYSTQELVRVDGTRFWCRISASAIDSHDASQGSVWMFDDVTAEREASELMRRAKEMAEDATRMKSDFLANMSHEIRTPMNAIVGMSRLALQTDLTPRQRNYLEKVDSASRALLAIINDILDFSKIEAGKMRFERINFQLEEVLESLADFCVVRAQEKELELLFDIAPDVPMALVGDPLRLGQVLLNLVGNAIKFTEHGEITLSITALPSTAPGETTLRFAVTDTGVGLAPQERDRLFTAFSQADASTTRKYGGTGLGLTISRALVQLMQGDIGVESEPGRGSTFHFTATLGLQPVQRQRASIDADVAALRILVVDDNARARDIMVAILRSQRFDCESVDSGEAAIAMLVDAQAQGRSFGLVLMDWFMPQMDGLATIRNVLVALPSAHLPAFVMVTAHNREELLEQARDLAIAGVLQKPVSPSSVLDSILLSLGKHVVAHGRRQLRDDAHAEAQQKLIGAHLLLVEDNPVNQELALEILQSGGMRVDVANHGAEAVGKVLRGNYDGVLMDVQMPVMDGYEASRQIRATAGFSDLPIIAMTANAMTGDREMCLAAGMNDHVGKPIDVTQLFNTLAQWITPKAAPESHAGRPTSAESESHAALPFVEGLDLRLAQQRLGGNAQLVRKLVRRFAETQRETMDRIRAAQRTGDLSLIAAEAHATKGLAGNIGASQLLEQAQAVERAARDGEVQNLERYVDEMEQTLLSVLGSIDVSANWNLTSARDSGTAEQQNGPLDRAELERNLASLAARLMDDDPSASAFVAPVLHGLRGLGQSEASVQLSRQLDRYDFEGALATLRQATAAAGLSIETAGDEA